MNKTENKEIILNADELKELKELGNKLVRNYSTLKVMLNGIDLIATPSELAEKNKREAILLKYDSVYSYIDSLFDNLHDIAKDLDHIGYTLQSIDDEE